MFEDSLGTHLDAGADLNGDGIGEVVALQAMRMPPRGYALSVFSGANGAPLWRLVDGTQIFETLRFVGDLDGDGKSEILCGTPYAPGGISVHTGRVALRSGANGALLYEVFGTGTLDYLGVAATALEDVDGDGTNDLAVGAPMTDPAQSTPLDRGYVWILSGRSGRALRRIDGPASLGGFGTALANVGDLDGDGASELCVGAPHEPLGGAAYLVSASNGAILRRLGGSAANAAFGTSIAVLGDLDGDGKKECAIGAPGENAGAGAVHLHSGASGAELAVIRGSAAAQIGALVARAGEVSGDGAEDLWLLVARPLPLPDLLRLFSARGTTRFGAGCRTAAAAPSLTLSSLRLGSTAQMLATRAPAFAPGCALLSRRPRLPLVLDASCTLYLEVATMFELARLTSDGAGSSSLAIQVPLDPWLAGLEVALQLGWADAGSASGFALTPAVYGAIEG
ncbi:MAG: FG-GAP repeat protein [Planctomycetes bacterium]|nr:FG-GAP repeat protein [Planctomycetota bacterium]